MRWIKKLWNCINAVLLGRRVDMMIIDGAKIEILRDCDMKYYANITINKEKVLVGGCVNKHIYKAFDCALEFITYMNKIKQF